jgi:hypothetical protein
MGACAGDSRADEAYESERQERQRARQSTTSRPVHAPSPGELMRQTLSQLARRNMTTRSRSRATTSEPALEPVHRLTSRSQPGTTSPQRSRLSRSASQQHAVAHPETGAQPQASSSGTVSERARQTVSTAQPAPTSLPQSQSTRNTSQRRLAVPQETEIQAQAHPSGEREPVLEGLLDSTSDQAGPSSGRHSRSSISTRKKESSRHIQTRQYPSSESLSAIQKKIVDLRADSKPPPAPSTGLRFNPDFPQATEFARSEIKTHEASTASSAPPPSTPPQERR